MRVVVVADTHLRPGSRRGLPERARAELRRADVILHAGDIVAGEVLDELAGYAPVHAVLGNNDTGLEGRLPEVLELTLGGVAVAMVHDSGPRTGRAARLARRFPAAEVVVFGHSHIPVLERSDAGQWLVNPGSPTQRRRQPAHTVAVLDLAGGEVRGAELVVVDPEP